MKRSRFKEVSWLLIDFQMLGMIYAETNTNNINKIRANICFMHNTILR